MRKDALPESMNIARIPAVLNGPKNSFFKYWLELMRPMHKLTTKEIDVLAFFLKKRYELSKSISDEKVLNQLLFSMEVRKELRLDLNMTPTYVHVVLAKFKKLNIITDEGLNKKFIPSIKVDDESYGLLFLFELK